MPLSRASILKVLQGPVKAHYGQLQGQLRESLPSRPGVSPNARQDAHFGETTRSKVDTIMIVSSVYSKIAGDCQPNIGCYGDRGPAPGGSKYGLLASLVNVYVKHNLYCVNPNPITVPPWTAESSNE